jgi:hypothetical protein
VLEVTPGDEGLGGEGGAASGSSVCTQSYDAGRQLSECHGDARVVLADGKLAFEFSDGSVAAWLGNDEAPAPQVAVGDRVWASFEQTITGCPFCGNSYSFRCSLRDREGGTLLHYGEALDPPVEIDAATVLELLGVPVRVEAACPFEPLTFACYDVTAERYDHVLETTPEQRIPSGVLTRVTSPNGDYTVIWSTVDVTATRITSCSDGPVPRDVRRFFASRVTAAAASGRAPGN